MADAAVSNTAGRKAVWVRIPPSLPTVVAIRRQTGSIPWPCFGCLKGKSDVDITVAGGLTYRSVIHATLQTYRAGVAIAAVRINYPSTGKARIHLTKVASTTTSTYVGWFVTEY
jgi:hypothetical protein